MVGGKKWWESIGMGLACMALSLALGAGTVAAGPEAGVAIFGDSLTTGGGTNPQLRFDADTLWSLFKGETPLAMGGENGPPRLLSRSPREYRGGLDWVYTNLLESLARLYLDTEAYSWGYQVARQLGAPADDIYMVAEDGARIEALSRQADRVLDHLGGRLPQRSFVLFSGNDLCAMHIAAITPAVEYGQQLQRGLQYLIRNGETTGSDIYVLGFLGVTQVLTKPAILDKELVAHGEKTTCRQLRERGYQAASPKLKVQHAESLYFQQFVPPNPASLCPTMFAQSFLARGEVGLFASLDQKERDRRVKQQVDEMISVLAGRVRQYRSEIAKGVSAVNAWAQKHFPSKRVKVHYLAEPELVAFEADDIADDCFHLSQAGQMKVAASVTEGMGRLATR